MHYFQVGLKAFHCEIINDHERLTKQEKNYQDIPLVRKLGTGEVQENYNRIKLDISRLVESELERMLDTPALAGMIIQRTWFMINRKQSIILDYNRLMSDLKLLASLYCFKKNGCCPINYYLPTAT